MSVEQYEELSLIDLPETEDHPAVYTRSILREIDRVLWQLFADPDAVIIDPFGGTGKLQQIAPLSIASDLQIKWLRRARGATLVADATRLPYRDSSIWAIITSPTYGNRFADCHVAKDGSERKSYTHCHGSELHERNTGTKQITDPEYKSLHVEAISEFHRVLRPGAPMLINISDHIREHEIVDVCGWWIEAVADAGFELVERRQIKTPRSKHGANSEARVSHEELHVWKVAA